MTLLQQWESPLKHQRENEEKKEIWIARPPSNTNTKLHILPIKGMLVMINHSLRVFLPSLLQEPQGGGEALSGRAMLTPSLMDAAATPQLNFAALGSRKTALCHSSPSPS